MSGPDQPSASASCSQRDRRTCRRRGRSCGPGCPPPPPGSAPLAPTPSGHDPDAPGTRPPSTASASSTWVVRFENTSRSSAGMPASSAWPLTIGPHATPYRWDSSAAQHRLVETAQHPLVTLQVAGVQRQPPTVRGLHLGRDDRVGVQLRVIGPRRGLAERRHRQPARVQVEAAAVGPHPGRGPEPLQVLERGGHGDVVSFQQAGVAGEGPPHTHGLRRREGRIETCHRPHRRPVGRRPVDQRIPERCPSRWVTPFEQPLQIVGRHPPVQARAPRPGGPSTRPAPPPAPGPGSGCSTPPSPPPRPRRASSPATSAHPARGHLSVDHLAVREGRHRQDSRLSPGRAATAARSTPRQARGSTRGVRWPATESSRRRASTGRASR